MQDICIYQIKLHGKIDEDELNGLSPLRLTLERTSIEGTWVHVCTDQSGLVGLLRHLHGLGFVFESIIRVE